KLIPVTSHLESAMRHINFKVESEIIPNVINLNIFTSERKADSNTIQFLHVSHLDDNHKNISGILRVWKEFAKEHSNVHLKIGGDGPVEKWKSFARQLEIPPRSISFFGTSSSKEIASIMHSSHAFVLFSNYENLPLVIIEAMACGLAVISTDVGGCKEFLPLELGHFLIQKKNESELKNALEIAIENATKIDRKAISEFAKEHFSQEVIGKKLNQVYQSILHDKI
ncbi:MAG: glycosyltransferase family 4 protein, partial [Bacteroidota bacterium]